jgi:hypothetical protein
VAPVPKKSFPLRLDQPLYDAVERLAAADLRSVNAELEVLLREALARRGIRVPVGVRAARGRPRKDQ